MSSPTSSNVVAGVKETPLPIRQFIPLTLILMNESFCQFMMVPFIGFLVAHLMNKPKEASGYVSGIMVGSFMVGQVISAKFWGNISDTYGRRFPLICGTFAAGFMMLGFSLSSHILVCALFRLLHGLFGGSILVVKTVIADVTDRTNMARGFSITALTFSVGFMIGPVIGSFLYDPCNSSFFTWLLRLSAESCARDSFFFARYPAFLVGLFIFLISMVSGVMCVLMLDESGKSPRPLPRYLTYIFFCMLYPWKQFEKPVDPTTTTLQPQSQSSPAAESDAQERMHVAASLNLEDSRLHISLEEMELEDYSDNASDDDHAATKGKRSDTRHTTAVVVENEDENEEEGNGPREELEEEGSKKKESFGYIEAFKNPRTRFMLSQYMLLCTADMVMRECFPLFAIASTAAGGLGYSKDRVSLVLMINAIPSFAVNLLYPRITKRYKNQVAVFRLGAGGSGIFVTTLVLVRYLFPNHNADAEGSASLLSTVMVVLCTSCGASFTPLCYATNMVFTAKVAPPAFVGALMGVNQSCGAITRAVTPMGLAALFAWSISDDRGFLTFFPFNFALVFVLSGLIYLYIWWRSYSIYTNSEGVLAMTGEEEEGAGMAESQGAQRRS